MLFGEAALLPERVINLVPKQQPFAAAVEYFASARNADCITALHFHTGFEADVLRTRALVRLRRLGEAEGTLRRAAESARNELDRAVCCTLLGAILDRQGDEEGADSEWASARKYLCGVAAPAVRAELNYYVALSAWRSKDIQEARRIARDSLIEVENAQCGSPSPYPAAVPIAFTYELLSLIEAMNERHEAQVAYLRQGFSALSSGAQAHVWPEASLLNNLASVITEVRMPDATQFVRERASALPWTGEMPGWAYNVYRALGWTEALEGNEIAAFRELRNAEAHAPTLPRRIEAILDRSFLFGAIGEVLSARERFDEAQQLCKLVDWNATQGEDRYALVWGAELAASFNPHRAQAMIAHYNSIRRPMDPMHAASGMLRRWQAYEHDAFGTVAAANGDLKVGLQHLTDALSIWDQLGFKWRAAKTARAIASFTKAESDDADAARRAASYHRSWLGRSA